MYRNRNIASYIIKSLSINNSSKSTLDDLCTVDEYILFDNLFLFHYITVFFKTDRPFIQPCRMLRNNLFLKRSQKLSQPTHELRPCIHPDSLTIQGRLMQQLFQEISRTSHQLG